MNRFPNLRLSTWLVAAAVAALAPSCGSDDSPSNPGNKQLCQPGSTQPCTGPAACQGGQTCASDGKSWGSCDCGAAGSGGGGAGGVDASAGSGGTSGASGSAGAGGNSGGADAGGDAQPPGPLDDPCPGQSPLVDHIDINCSDQCQATDTAKCAALTSCAIVPAQAATVKSSAELPFTVRLPAKPGLGCPCKYTLSLPPGPPQFVFWFRIDASVATKTLWAKVDEPWYIAAPQVGPIDNCVDDTVPNTKWRKGCVTLFAGTADRWIAVGTNDPNAPSRTLVLRKPWGTESICPPAWQ